MLKIFILLLISVILISTISNTYALDIYTLDKVSTKGHIIGGNPFVGNAVWTILEGDTGTIVATSNHGIVTIRFNTEQNQSCLDSPSKICLSATVYETKNSISVQKGDIIEMIFDMPIRQQITIKSGDLESLQLELILDSVKYKKPINEINKKINDEQDAVEIAALTKLQTTIALTKEPIIINDLRNSLNEYSTINEAITIIKERDIQWKSLSENESNDFIESLLSTQTSQFLRDVIDEDRKKDQVFTISEIIVTNALGVNVAQTGKTTDYVQSDEEWWQMAKIDTFYIDVGFDQSVNAKAASTSIRIIDENGMFLGIVKIVATMS